MRANEGKGRHTSKRRATRRRDRDETATRPRKHASPRVPSEKTRVVDGAHARARSIAPTPGCGAMARVARLPRARKRSEMTSTTLASVDAGSTREICRDRSRARGRRLTVEAPRRISGGVRWGETTCHHRGGTREGDARTHRRLEGKVAHRRRTRDDALARRQTSSKRHARATELSP